MTPAEAVAAMVANGLRLRAAILALAHPPAVVGEAFDALAQLRPHLDGPDLASTSSCRVRSSSARRCCSHAMRTCMVVIH